MPRLHTCLLIRRRLKRSWNLENSHGESHGLHKTGWRDQKYRERRPQLRLSTQSVVGVTHLTLRLVQHSGRASGDVPECAHVQGAAGGRIWVSGDTPASPVISECTGPLA